MKKKLNIFSFKWLECLGKRILAFFANKLCNLTLNIKGLISFIKIYFKWNEIVINQMHIITIYILVKYLQTHNFNCTRSER